MIRITHFIFSVLAAVVLLLSAASAHAAGFTLTYSGPNLSGTLFLNATANGDGTYTVISATGSQTFGGMTQTVTGLVPLNGISPSIFYISMNPPHYYRGVFRSLIVGPYSSTLLACPNPSAFITTAPAFMGVG
jgi:hypothetical protein